MFNLCWAKQCQDSEAWFRFVHQTPCSYCTTEGLQVVRDANKTSTTERIQTLRGSITFIEPFNLPYNETKNVSVDERKCLPLYKYDANSPSMHLGPKRLAAHCSNNHKAKERLHKKQSKTPEQRMTRYLNQPSSTFLQPK
jgi:hypothetical protein